ncbi:hypothetical protein Tco_0054070 [Tanacetum coccineum]
MFPLTVNKRIRSKGLWHERGRNSTSSLLRLRSTILLYLNDDDDDKDDGNRLRGSEWQALLPQLVFQTKSSTSSSVAEMRYRGGLR